MPTHGYQGNCSSEVIDVSDIFYSKISSTMANNSACKSLIGSCYVFRIKSICNGTFGTSHVFIEKGTKAQMLKYGLTVN